MNNLKVLFFLAAMTCVGVSHAQIEPDIIILRTYEKNNAKGHIIVSGKGEIIQSIEMENSISSKNWEINQKIIDNALNSYLKAGYEITTSHGAGNGITAISTYVLERANEAKEE